MLTPAATGAPLHRRLFNTDGNGTTFSLDPWGGQQEARGDSKGAEWRLDNLLEELDVEREWFHDEATGKLCEQQHSNCVVHVLW